MSDPTYAIEVEHLAKTFAGGRVSVLADVNLRVGAGDLVVLVGPSGSGKSTTLHLLAALMQPDSGNISVLGTDVTRGHHLDRYRRIDVGIVFQLHNLLPHLDVSQNIDIVMMGTHAHHAERQERIEDLLERLDLSAHRHSMPPQLSGGERQRVAVARAFANHPGVILADEPTGSLDDEAAARVVELLREHCAHGGTVVAVSHDARLTAAADRIVRIETGVAVEAKTLDNYEDRITTRQGAAR